MDSLIQSSKPILAHQMSVTEVPAMIAVETIFITDQLAKQRDIQLSETLILSTIDIDSHDEINTDAILCKMQDVGIMVEPDVAHAAGQTESVNPQRDREVQTMKLPNQKDIGIQCEWETDTFYEESPLNVNYTSEDFNRKCYEQFMDFVRENTFVYDNTKTECMKCGEVCSNFEQTLSHMAVHKGPSALCEICGRCFEHSSQLSLHQCGFGPPKKYNKRLTHKQCPLFTCGIVFQSKSKLFRHINGHMKRAVDKSSTTKRSNISSISSGTKRSLIEKLSTHKIPGRGTLKDVLRCQICLSRSTRSSVFTRHRNKCIKGFNERLKNIQQSRSSN